MMDRSIWVGWDPRETDAFAVALSSIARCAKDIAVHGVFLPELQRAGLYTRPMEYRETPGGRIMWDMISDAPMSTQHACARFLVPHLARTGWALFVDGDILVRADLGELFEALDPSKALYCVHHDHRPARAFKMDRQVQTAYARKNWSSVMALNCDHRANAVLTLDLVNGVPGRQLHRFSWLSDDEIGALDPAWNWLAGESDPAIEPKIVHFTSGTPDMPGYEDVPFADEWRAALLATKGERAA